MRRAASLAIVLTLSVSSGAYGVSQESGGLGVAATFVVICGLEQGTAWQFTAGKFLTANHVVSQCASVQILTPSGEVTAHVTRRNAVYDVAEIHSSFQAPLSIALATQQPSIGSALEIRSAPDGNLTTTKGKMVSEETLNGIPALQVSAKVAPGSSGGVVMNASGQAVALVQDELLDGSHDAMAIRQPYLSLFIAGALLHTVAGTAGMGRNRGLNLTLLVVTILTFLSGAATAWTISVRRFRRAMGTDRDSDTVHAILGSVYWDGDGEWPM